MRYKGLVIGSIILGIAISGCARHSEGDNDIVGRWRCGIADSDIVGVEYINIMPDGVLEIEDSIKYTQEEEFIRVTVVATVKNSGSWTDSQQTLTFSLKETEATIDTTSLSIISTNPEIKIDSASNDFHKFRRYLLRELEENLLLKFDGRSGKDVSMGRVKMVGKNEMRLFHNNIKVSMQRVRNKGR
ncbi:MAG: hypothetical protein K2J70_04915 [Muribaculaceae bacterium]|nr:hypothetical protein [Muribaculaceae bacterium]